MFGRFWSLDLKTDPSTNNWGLFGILKKVYIYAVSCEYVKQTPILPSIFSPDYPDEHNITISKHNITILLLVNIHPILLLVNTILL